MTPADDPSAVTLPRLGITREGVWVHDGVEVTHPGILAALWEALRIDAAGHHLQVGSVRVPVEVEDAPFVVVRVEDAGDRLMLALVDGSREPLAPDTLLVDAGGIPYCRVKDGRFRARLSRAAAYQLLQHAEADDDGAGAALVIAGTRYPLAEAPPRG